MRNLIAEMFRRNRLLAVVSVAHLALFVLLVPAVLLDSTPILGVSRWIKPVKFAISIAIFTGTMAWLLAYLEQSRRAIRVVSGIIAFTMAGEMILIVMQAFRGVRSHFNHDTPFDNTVFSIMGVFIVVNTLAAAWAAWLFFRRPVSISGAYRTAVRLGLIIFVAASLEAGFMVARNSHSVGVHDGGPGLPLVNWSSGGGDLRVAHFVGMHALQGLPLLAWWLERRRTPRARSLVIATAIVWFAVTALLVVQALAGRPLLAMT